MIEGNSWEARHQRARDSLIPWIEQTVKLSGATVLEYGCGHAPVSCAFADRGARVLGFDIDADYIRDAREYVRSHGAKGLVELSAHPPEEILAAVGARRGEPDVFLLYAVLEHLTLEERLAVLRLARQVVKPDGVIVVCETPNRLAVFDHHTTQLPFFNVLPDDLALLYYKRSERPDFLEAMRDAAARGIDAERETLLRWGRGVSYHDFEIVFGDLSRHMIASSYDPVLFEERPVNPKELLVARYLAEVRPDLAPAWSRWWLDLILTPQPHDREPKFIRPWTIDTSESPAVAWTRWDILHLPDPKTRLTVTLPEPAERLVVGAIVGGESVTVEARVPGTRRPIALTLPTRPGEVAYADLRLKKPTDRVEVGLDSSGYVAFVGYEA